MASNNEHSNLSDEFLSEMLNLIGFIFGSDVKLNNLTGKQIKGLRMSGREREAFDLLKFRESCQDEEVRANVIKKGRIILNNHLVCKNTKVEFKNLSREHEREITEANELAKFSEIFNPDNFLTDLNELEDILATLH